MSLTSRPSRTEFRASVAGILSAGWRGILSAVILAVGGVSGAWGADGWLTNYEDALAQAEHKGRPILVIFTGSDWCPHCRTLEQNVLQTETFRDWAADRLVLLMIDLPQEGISVEERRARSRVCVNYGVRIFPSALLLAPDGTKLALQTGYTGQTATTWVSAMGDHLPPPVLRHADKTDDRSLATLDDAVATARSTRRPILVMVSRPNDAAASSTVATLVSDPEFEALARDNFVVATVPAAVAEAAVVAGLGSEPGSAPETAGFERLLAGTSLEIDGVELIVTDDGQTPLYVQSGRESPQRVVTGLRRFLAGRPQVRR
jgi:thiol-disulfide isomerase/thioredoxin